MTTKQSAHINARVAVHTPLYVHLVGAIALIAMLYAPVWIMTASLKLPPAASASVGAQYALAR